MLSALSLSLCKLRDVSRIINHDGQAGPPAPHRVQSPPCPGPCCLLTANACCVQVASQGTNSQGSSYTNYSDGGYRYSNSNGSSYYSPSGIGAGFYNGGSSGNQSFYGRADSSRKYF